MTTPADIIAHYRAKLAFETDPSDVYAAQKAGESFVLVDTRSAEAWAQGRAKGAIHLPTREIADRAAAEIPAGTPVVVYCWSPGCNRGDKAAAVLRQNFARALGTSPTAYRARFTCRPDEPIRLPDRELALA